MPRNTGPEPRDMAVSAPPYDQFDLSYPLRRMLTHIYVHPEDTDLCLVKNFERVVMAPSFPMEMWEIISTHSGWVRAKEIERLPSEAIKYWEGLEWRQTPKFYELFIAGLVLGRAFTLLVFRLQHEDYLVDKMNIMVSAIEGSKSFRWSNTGLKGRLCQEVMDMIFKELKSAHVEHCEHQALKLLRSVMWPVVVNSEEPQRGIYKSFSMRCAFVSAILGVSCYKTLESWHVESELEAGTYFDFCRLFIRDTCPWLQNSDWVIIPDLFEWACKHINDEKDDLGSADIARQWANAALGM